MTRTRLEFIHEGKYAAEVDIELEYSDESWSPTMSADDAKKFDAVRLALRRGDVAEAVNAVMPAMRYRRFSGATSRALLGYLRLGQQTRISESLHDGLLCVPGGFVFTLVQVPPTDTLQT